MEMSNEYMDESATFLEGKGFVVERERQEIEIDGEGEALLFRYLFYRGEHERFAMETWQYPSGEERYYLEIERYYKIASTSFPLDSWKYKPHQIEFKYYVVDRSSMGLSFILNLEEEEKA